MEWDNGKFAPPLNLPLHFAFNNKCINNSLTFELGQWNGMLLKYLMDAQPELEMFDWDTRWSVYQINVSKVI